MFNRIDEIFLRNDNISTYFYIKVRTSDTHAHVRPINQKILLFRLRNLVEFIMIV